MLRRTRCPAMNKESAGTFQNLAQQNYEQSSFATSYCLCESRTSSRPCLQDATAIFLPFLPFPSASFAFPRAMLKIVSFPLLFLLLLLLLRPMQILLLPYPFVRTKQPLLPFLPPQYQSSESHYGACNALSSTSMHSRRPLVPPFPLLPPPRNGDSANRKRIGFQRSTERAGNPLLIHLPPNSPDCPSSTSEPHIPTAICPLPS